MARRRLPPGEEEPPEPPEDPPPPTPPPPPEDTEPPPVIVPPFVLPAPPSVAELPDDRLASAGFGGAWPALLLPVRIETRWMPAPGSPAGLAGFELRVRLFPDVLHVASERAGIDADEATLAAAFLAAGTDVTSTDDASAAAQAPAVAARRRAWDELVRLRGAPRAAQAVLRVRAGMVASTAADAADTETQTHAHLLPTRFALVLDSGPTVGPRVAWGADIPALLPAGLADPSAEATRWQFDFDAAERAGLALRVPFDALAAPALQRIVALGLRDGTPDAQAQALGEHLERQFGSSGAELLAVGTPTNNTDDAPSGFDSATRAAAQSAALLLTGEPLPAGSEGARLALACGLPEATLRPWAGARAQTDADAAAMHTALWPGTLGTWLRRLLAPAVPAPARAFMQQLFIDDVRARGPLPTLRIGRQPYGVLPATALMRWRGGADTAVAAHVLRELRTHFAALAQAQTSVPTLHRGGGETVLREALALLPSSRRFGVRRLRPSTFRGGPAVMESVRLWAALAPVFERMGLMAKPALARWFHGPQAFWSSLALVSAAQADKTQPLAANYLATLGAPLDGGGLRTHQVPGAAPASLLYLLLRAGLLEQALDVVEDVFGTTTVEVRDHRVNPPSTTTERAWSVLFRMPHARLGDQTVAQAMARVFSASDDVVAGAGDAAALLAPIRRQRGGMARIANAPVATLERLLHETLDVAAYRLDAWVTALAARRLRELRAATPAGLHIGAWGWVSAPPLPVLPAVPGGPARSDGYELAPSLAHARTAAVLRSGFNRHRSSGGDSNSNSSTGAMAVDLASNRVRAALDTLRLARAGQGVGELLGRRLERWLVDQGLGTQTPALRTQAPLGSGRIGIDAVALAEQWAAQPPGAPLVEAAAQLHEWVDGLADLMFAEGLHHTVNSQPERARAALDAMERGETLPAEVEVTQGPRASASSAWRLALVLPSGADADAAAVAAWPGSTASVRASAAPLLDAWAASLLGGPKTLHWVVSGRSAKGLARSVKVTPVDAGLAALDVVLLSRRGAVLTALATQVALGKGAKALAQIDSVEPNAALQTALLVARALARLLSSAVPEPADSAAALERTSAALQALRTEGDSAGAQRRRAAWSGGEAAVSVLDERLAAAPAEPQARVEALTGLRGTGGVAQDLAPFAGVSGAAGVAADLSAVLGAPSPSAWLHDLGRLRPALAALAALVLARPAAFAGRWSVRLEADGTRSVLFGAAPAATRGALLVLDRWAEAQPAALATAALALHVDAPRAAAPQSMLLAVSPTPEAPWSLSALADVVTETIDMLPLRLLPPSAVAGQYLPGLYVADDLDGEALGALAGSAMRIVPG